MARRKQKLYTLQASPLYRVWTRKRLIEKLHISDQQLDKALIGSQYRQFETEDGRQCEQPIGISRKIHDRIATLLSRLECPEYLHSVKGRSYASNAVEHVGGFPSVKVDLRKFFPSVKYKRIWEFFRFDLDCSATVALLLTDLCTFEGKLPTGSPVSAYLAFHANARMFSDLNELALENHCVMTVYVDDITFTGPYAGADLLEQAISIVRRNALKHNRYKSRVLAAGKPKSITGVIVLAKGIAVPNSRQRKIGQLFAEHQFNDSNQSRLVGRLWEAAQIEQRFRLKVATASGSPTVGATTPTEVGAELSEIPPWEDS